MYNGAGKYSSAINMLVTETVKVDSFLGDVLNFDKLDEELKKYTPDDLAAKSLLIKID